MLQVLRQADCEQGGAEEALLLGGMQEVLVESSSRIQQTQGGSHTHHHLQMLREGLHHMGPAQSGLLLPCMLHQSSVRREAMMEKACFNTQVSYCLAMSYARELLENKLITEGEMVAMEESLSASEKPLIRELTPSINLT